MKSYRYWLVFSLFNLIIVALLGSLMRYKIGFEFPYFNQKNLLHGHSHFAFAGWITQTLMVLMAMRFNSRVPATEQVSFKGVLIANAVTAYGMLFSLSMQGYGAAGITSSVLSILVFYFFGWRYASLMRKRKELFPEGAWYRAALFFGIISTLGSFTLAWMMISKNINQHWYLGALYFFLHFQYNGWFFFACMGLLWGRWCEIVPELSSDHSVFRMLAVSCIPAYLLSTLWLHFPVWVILIIVVFAALQMYGWIRLLQLTKKFASRILPAISKTGRLLLLFVAITTSIKFLLQLFSTIPALSQLAFGFRPIVIAYLHLILLAVITVFLLSWLYENRLIRTTRMFLVALIIFISGVFLNELALMIQGIASFAYFPIPHINESLFVIALLLLTGAMLMFLSQVRGNFSS